DLQLFGPAASRCFGEVDVEGVHRPPRTTSRGTMPGHPSSFPHRLPGRWASRYCCADPAISLWLPRHSLCMPSASTMLFVISSRDAPAVQDSNGASIHERHAGEATQFVPNLAQQGSDARLGRQLERQLLHSAV